MVKALIGMGVTCGCMYFMGQDYRALQQAWDLLQHTHNLNINTMEQLIRMQYLIAVVDTHRINCFAEGVGALLGLLLTSLPESCS